MTTGPRRLEELTLNSSAPPGQLLYDGWLLRFSPGKAKRARSINAIYPSRLSIEEKVAHCEHVYGERGLPAIYRLSVHTDPRGLDGLLAEGLLSPTFRTKGDAEMTGHRILAYLTPAAGSATLLSGERRFEIMTHQHSQCTYFCTCSCSERA